MEIGRNGEGEVSEMPRPWLCPEPRCTPLHNLRDGDYRDIRVPEPGQTWFCAGLMETPIKFEYDGVEHPNDLRSCAYTPLKGLVAWQENEADWENLRDFYGMALRKVQARRTS